MAEESHLANLEYAGRWRHCASCRRPITERHLVTSEQLNCDVVWHVTCARCCVCDTPLDGPTSRCFMQSGRLFCDHHHYDGINSGVSPSSSTATRSSDSSSSSSSSVGDNVPAASERVPPVCARCGATLSATDWVRRAVTSSTPGGCLAAAEDVLLYHLACFTCDVCDGQLATGDECAVYGGRLFCRKHFLRLKTSRLRLHSSSAAAAADISDSDSDVIGSDAVTSRRRRRRRLRDVRARPTRCRTTFSVDQLTELESALAANSSPDAVDVDRLAVRLGLTRRVVQVWFQNARSRLRKQRNQQQQQQQRGVVWAAPLHALSFSENNNID